MQKGMSLWSHSGGHYWNYYPGALYKSRLIPGLRPANERRRYKATASLYLGANLESAL